jgi:branched-chain amino acid transport system substrate-binding protein
MLNWAKNKFLLLLAVFFFEVAPAGTVPQESKPLRSNRLTNDWIVGVDADLTLGGASSGQAILRGVRIAAEEINASGGVLGRRIRIEARDHASVVLRGIENVKELAEYENLIGVVGGIHSNVILSELKYIHEMKIPYLIPWAAANELVENGFFPNFVFRLGARDQDVGRFLLSEALKRGNRIALLLETTVWGRSNHKSIAKELADRGLKPVAVEWIDRADNDVNVQISAIQKSKPDVVIMALNSPEGALAIKTMAARSANFEILSHWGVAQKNFFSMASDALKKIRLEFFQPFSVLESGFKKRILLAEKVMREDKIDSITAINSFAGIAHAYDLTRMLALAVRKANSGDRTKIRSSLEKLDSFEGASCPLSPPFTPKRHEANNLACYVLAKFNSSGEIVSQIQGSRP